MANFWLIVVVAGTLFTVGRLFFVNRFTVEHPERHRLVIRNVYTAEYRVLGGDEGDPTNGTTSWGPWWVLDQEVELNREPRTTEPEGHLVRSADGVEFIIKARRDDLIGRPCNQHNGAITERSLIKNELVIEAVTKTDYKTRGEYISGVFSAALDRVIGSYTADQLTRPELGTGVLVPRSKIPDPNDAFAPPILIKTPQIYVTTIADLWTEMSEEIEALTNLGLKDVALNVDAVKIEDLRIKDPAQQAALEHTLLNRNQARAKEELDKGKKLDLSDREKMAIGTPHQGEVAQAQATHALAGMGTAISAAIQAAGGVIAAAVEQKGKSPTT